MDSPFGMEHITQHQLKGNQIDGVLKAAQVVVVQLLQNVLEKCFLMLCNTICNCQQSVAQASAATFEHAQDDRILCVLLGTKLLQHCMPSTIPPKTSEKASELTAMPDCIVI